MTPNVLPLISVIIPVYNAERYLKEALESVFSQTYGNIEVICVDDGSTDGSLAILKSYGDRIILVECGINGGIGEARNRGIAKATGEHIAFMDADDIWVPEKLMRQRAAFDNDPSLDICFGRMRQFISPDASEETKRLRYCDPSPMPGHIAATMLIPVGSFKKVGLFNSKWRVGEFVDWLKRAQEAGLTTHMIEDVALMRRIHETNTVLTKRADFSDYLRIAKEALDRKKRQ
jgi:glycosyltransferase involved in cell wall biosynthesis